MASQKPAQSVEALSLETPSTHHHSISIASIAGSWVPFGVNVVMNDEIGGDSTMIGVVFVEYFCPRRRRRHQLYREAQATCFRAISSAVIPIRTPIQAESVTHSV